MLCWYLKKDVYILLETADSIIFNGRVNVALSIKEK